MRHHAPLTRDEELGLVTAYRAGDTRARDRLVAHCWPLVLATARRGSKDRDDLVQAGAVGVMRGLEHFDPSHQVRLTTYVKHWVRKEVLDHIARNRSLLYVARPARELGVCPLSGEYDEVEHSSAAGDDTTGRKAAGDEPNPEELAAAREVADLVACVPGERARGVLRRRVMGDETLEAIGSSLGVTRERARQLEQGALASLRKLAGVPATARQAPSLGVGASAGLRAA